MNDPGTAQSVPPPSRFEVGLSDLINASWDRGSGTVWTETAKFLANELGLQAAEVGAISVTTDNVIKNRPLSAGLINRPRRILLIPVAQDVGLTRQAKAIEELIPLTKHLKTVLLAEKIEDVWRVRRVVARAGHEADVELVAHHFPAISSTQLVADDLLESVTSHEEATLPGLLSPDQTDSDDLERSDTAQLRVPELQAIVEGIVTDLSSAKIHLPEVEDVAWRCVLALMSGHLVLQGPPGTAKSTLARLLCRAFDTSSTMVTATADWTTYDVIGGYRPDRDENGAETLGAFEGCVTAAVRRCDSTVKDNLARRSSSQAHWLIIDELSRAEIDKAIGPLYSVLGNDDENTIDLWFDDTDPVLTIPNRFRIIATLNDVDTSYAYTLSQGLSRRFTFVELSVSGGVSDEEMATVVDRAADWAAGTYPELGSEDPTELKAALRTSPASEAIEALHDLITLIRSGELGRAFPLGTAQLIDVVKRVALTHGGPLAPSVVVDQAVADLLIPQLANLDSASMRSLTEYLQAGERNTWTITARRLKTLINPISTI